MGFTSLQSALVPGDFFLGAEIGTVALYKARIRAANEGLCSASSAAAVASAVPTRFTSSKPSDWATSFAASVALGLRFAAVDMPQHFRHDLGRHTLRNEQRRSSVAKVVEPYT